MKNKPYLFEDGTNTYNKDLNSGTNVSNRNSNYKSSHFSNDSNPLERLAKRLAEKI